MHLLNKYTKYLLKDKNEIYVVEWDVRFPTVNFISESNLQELEVNLSFNKNNSIINHQTKRGSKGPL